MRPPRYRFPDEVRSAIRTSANRQVQEGNISRTPEELEQWLAREDDVRVVMEDGGYGPEFDAAEVLPLLHVFVVQAGGPDLNAPAEPEAAPGRGRWMIALVIALLLVIVVVVIAARALSQPDHASVSMERVPGAVLRG
ncbi:MAG TPA: hypothetical protein VF665_11395 [Longimicrobium sp.]|jgi:hypothetical protein|uniref:hypothetical protein n=1 Tax=Longimicrobium sp. TaxID=2029185 RepID=UPI002EDA58B2